MTVRNYDADTKLFLGIDTYYAVFIRIVAGATVDNLTFYPMLRYTGIKDDTYESFIPSLLERIEALEAKIETLLSAS